jgi:hypothetical protein
MDKTVFLHYVPIDPRTSYSIPSTITNIYRYSFYSANNLKQVTIPASVTTMGTRVFFHCDSIEKFIVDSTHIMPSDVVPYLDRDKWDIYFIGYPNISKFTKFSTIRKYDDNTDWTSRRSDEELLSIVEKLISISKKIQEECEELDIPFIDTSSDMIEVIDEFFETELI